MIIVAELLCAAQSEKNLLPTTEFDKAVLFVRPSSTSTIGHHRFYIPRALMISCQIWALALEARASGQVGQGSPISRLARACETGGTQIGTDCPGNCVRRGAKHHGAAIGIGVSALGKVGSQENQSGHKDAFHGKPHCTIVLSHPNRPLVTHNLL